MAALGLSVPGSSQHHSNVRFATARNQMHLFGFELFLSIRVIDSENMINFAQNNELNYETIRENLSASF